MKTLKNRYVLVSLALAIGSVFGGGVVASVKSKLNNESEIA